MDPAALHVRLRDQVRALLPSINNNSWFSHNGNKFMKLSDTLAIPEQQFSMMGITFNDNETLSTFDFEKFSKYLSLSDNARNQNLTTLTEKRMALNTLRSEYHSLKAELVQTKSEVIKLDDENRKLELSTLEAEKRSCGAETRCQNLESQLNSKDIELNFKTQEIARLTADAQKATSSKNFLLTPKVIIPVSTIAVLEVAAIQTSTPQLAPSYWCRQAWASIFCSSDANLSQPEKETASSNIGSERSILDLSVNPEFKEYRGVQVQSVVSPTPPNGLIRSSPLISLFSFIL
jgi:hypothetical protein